MKKSWLIYGISVIIVLGFLLIFFGSGDSLEATFENGAIVYLKVADEPRELEKGLMGVRSLAKDEGMIFVYSEEKIRHFWMKDVKIDLDIIFLNFEKEIVNIKTMKPCRSETCITYSSNSPSQYAIEVNEGYVRKNGISIGQRVDFEL